MQAYILIPQGAHQAQTLKSDAKEDRREVRGNLTQQGQRERSQPDK